jgi:hypothetical protein
LPTQELRALLSGPPAYGGYIGPMATHLAFTVEAANELIIWVESVFLRIDSHRERWQKHHESLQILEVMWSDRIESPENPDHDEYLQQRRGAEDAARTIEGIVKQDLLARGLRIPAGGIEGGIVDFPSTFEGHWIYLCWQRGEARLTHWHEVDTGFRGRRELLDEHSIVMGHDEELPDDSSLDF